MEDSSRENFDFMNLPDHVKVNVLYFCTFKTMMNATETCREINEIVSTESKLENRIILRKRSEDEKNVDGILEIWQKCKRRYKNVRVVEDSTTDPPERSIELLQSWMNVFQVKGSFLRELAINIRKCDIVDLLMHCGNLEILRIGTNYDDATRLDRRLNLPKLESLSLFHTQFDYVQFFSNIRSLKLFRLIYWKHIQEEEDVAKLENFILQQDNLKQLNLFIKFQMPRGLFPKNRLSDVKFQLQSMNVTGSDSSLLDSRIQFLKTQNASLKNLIPIQKEDLFVLTNLENLIISEKVDWNALVNAGVQGLSMKYVSIGGNNSSEEMEQIFKVYPKVGLVMIGGQNCKRLTMSSQYLKVLNFKESYKVDFHNPLGKRYFLFDYQPTEPSNNLARDACNIFFFICLHQSIKHIKITIKTSNDLVCQWPSCFEEDVRRFLPGLKTLDVIIFSDDMISVQ